MWPFRKEEHRAAGYSDAVVAAIVAAAGGSKANPLQTGALEAAAGLVGRAFAAAN